MIRAFNPTSLTPPEGAHTLIEWLKATSEAGPLDIEIGCGTGWHPIRYVSSHKNRRLVAFEHTRAKFERFSNRLKNHEKLPNLLALNGEAVRWITHAVQKEEVSRYLLLYPNPEPKAANKRWMRSPAMHLLMSTLKLGGELHMATNEAWYAEEALEFAKSAWGLELIEERRLNSLHLPEARTLFEKKYLARGETCFDLRWRKMRG